MSEPTRILCIDDDEQIRFALGALCESQGWRPLTAGDVQEGLSLFFREKPDMVLIDYHMPRINGVEGVKMLRQLSQTVPILVFTIDDDQAIADEFLRAGANDFALKPIKAPDLISRIKLHIRLMQAQRDPHGNASWTKGISRVTMELIIDALKKETEPHTVQWIAEKTGLATQTTYRYLQYMVSEQTVEALNVYGKVGRPKQKFILTLKGEK